MWLVLELRKGNQEWEQMWESRERLMLSVLTLNSAPAFGGLWPGGNSDLVGRC